MNTATYIDLQNRLWEILPDYDLETIEEVLKYEVRETRKQRAQSALGR